MSARNVAHRILCWLVWHRYGIAIDADNRVFWRCRYCGREVGK